MLVVGLVVLALGAALVIWRLLMPSKDQLTAEPVTSTASPTAPASSATPPTSDAPSTAASSSAPASPSSASPTPAAPSSALKASTGTKPSASSTTGGNDGSGKGTNGSRTGGSKSGGSNGDGSGNGNGGGSGNGGSGGGSNAGCMTTLTPITATRMRIPSMGVSSPVMSVGTDANGAAGAPPKSASHTTAWWTGGPRVGSSQGKAVLTIHTYRNGGALGNSMASNFNTGSIVRLSDSSGRTQCYQLVKRTKVWVKSYDPNSNAVYDNSGRPQIVIVTCWDFNWSTQNWDSRLLYYLEPLAG